MANIRAKVTNRHDWTYRPLPGLPGALELKKLGLQKMGFLCMNCRKAWDPDDGSPPVDGCLSGVKVMNLGPARQADYTQQERRIMAEQAERIHADDQRMT